ncbi:type II secretion system F family protein [Thioalkalivibrio sp. ALE9]|uniref:type II secretion system F family protein n=1 Tax=Thioalkalivibrio sp. ALE9 TaxID=1158169 RepID=UPI00036961AE|nr:type II secretion system F family protein [Thioalkalivibrio sp. ALE9]
MPTFYYKVATSSGETAEGELEAVDEAAAVAQLQAAGHIPIRVASGGGFKWAAFPTAGRLRSQELQIFTQELATLLAAGLPLDRSLQILIDLADRPRTRQLTERILEFVRGGGTLSDALEAQTGTFSRFYVNMVRAGEMSGSLEQVLHRLSDYLVRSRELRDSVVSALVYPAILLTVSVLSVLILMVFVVPQFTQLFEDAGEALPLLTQMVVGAAEWLGSYWWSIPLFVILAGFYMHRQLGHPDSRERWDRVTLRLPLVGELVRRLEAARFSRTLGTLLGNGVPLLAALTIVRETLSNRLMVRGVDSAIEGLRGGQGMSEPLKESALLPKLGMQMIQVGEETGQLEGMLIQVADLYDREVRTAVQRMLSLLEPLLIVTLGVVIALIIISILVAIVSVNELAF